MSLYQYGVLESLFDACGYVVVKLILSINDIFKHVEVMLIWNEQF